MAIISVIGRKDPKVRLLLLAIYTVLILGGITMIYPFLLMISGSTKSEVDRQEMKIIPSYLLEDEALYKKYTADLFNESVDYYNYVYDEHVTSFKKLSLPQEDKNQNKLVDDWRQFLQESDLLGYRYTIGFFDTRNSRTVPKNLRLMKNMIRKNYGKDISTVNQKLGTEFLGWSFVAPLVEDYLNSRKKLDYSIWGTFFRKFKKSIPEENRYYFNVQGYYKKFFLISKYSKNIEKYNKKHGTKYQSYDDIFLPTRFPVDAKSKLMKKDWEVFTRQAINTLWIKLDESVTDFYRQYLSARYNNIHSLNKLYKSQYKTFSEIPLFNNPTEQTVQKNEWVDFIRGWTSPNGKKFQVPVEALIINSTEFQFRQYLLGKYKTLPELNAKLATNIKEINRIIPPQKQFHYLHFEKTKTDSRWDFTTRNYKTVVDYMILNGRAIFNTVIYVFLAVLSALIVNPMAAYAMSRYKLPSTYTILLFLMLTMAFPPLVTNIPTFLMMREFNMLNTFYALILPSLAHGYSIFLLKGFFDSLPQELYESAGLDGANEWKMFWMITMSLSKPILAVIALQAFTRAYSNFMFAFLTCQDESMWTIMVYLYQLQQRTGAGVMFASIILASAPTFLIFLFCQNIIMRGIVVPSEK